MSYWYQYPVRYEFCILPENTVSIYNLLELELNLLD